MRLRELRLYLMLFGNPTLGELSRLKGMVR